MTSAVLLLTACGAAAPSDTFAKLLAATADRDHAHRGELPLGGQRIVGKYRVVAYYGAPGGSALGVLGSASPDTMAARIAARARRWRGYGAKVQPAMELIATVAQGAPGPDGRYSQPLPIAQARRYLAAAHRHKMLLVLDFQPGRGEFLPQVKQFASMLADPWVSVALDPEWKMGPHRVPGTVIGSTRSDDVLAVRDYLAKIVTAHHLPDKMLLLHQFQLAMLPDRAHIRPRTGVEVVFHADGFGTRQLKLATWRGLAFPNKPFGAGFKLFLNQDTGLMTPKQVMRIRPRPDVITYQ